jgi:hypothetical protein
MTMKALLAGVLAAMIAGCASYSGSGLQPGQARLADVERAMGAPAERVNAPNGDTHLYYPRGRQTYVAAIGADGTLRGIEQRLSYASFQKLVPNTTQAKEVRELLGPPQRVSRMERQQRDVWEYQWRNYEEMRILWVQFSYDGTLRETIELRDEAAYPQSGPAKP